MSNYWCDWCDGNGERYDMFDATPCKHCSGTGYASTNYYGSDDPEEQRRRAKEDPNNEDNW